jgi:hypothetical protein
MGDSVEKQVDFSSFERTIVSDGVLEINPRRVSLCDVLEWD